MLPKKLVVGHMTITVEYNDSECHALGSDGHTCVGARTISIKGDLCADREREVMLHEALHVVVEATTIEVEEAEEEALVNALTGPLLDLIRRNPKLVTYLTEA